MVYTEPAAIRIAAVRYTGPHLHDSVMVVMGEHGANSNSERRCGAENLGDSAIKLGKLPVSSTGAKGGRVAQANG
jgi:hypothetical protein